MVLNVAVCIETFWAHVGGLRRLGLLLRTCKSVRSNCDLVFCVRSMLTAGDKKISKIWAQRWLGVCVHWMTPIKASDMTLLTALKIIKQRGGLAPNYKRGHLLRLKDAARKNQLKEAWQQRLDALNARSAALAVRKTELDARIKQEGLPAGRRGYYDECLRALTRPIDDAMMAELRFRGRMWRNHDYNRIVEQLAEDRGGWFYRGIHAHARIVFRANFEVDAKGNVGRKRTVAAAYELGPIDDDYVVSSNVENSSDDDDDDII